MSEAMTQVLAVEPVLIQSIFVAQLRFHLSGKWKRDLKILTFPQLWSKLKQRAASK